MWERFGVGGEVEGAESGDEGGEEVLPEGMEGERLRLAGDGEHLSKIFGPSLLTGNESKNIMRRVMLCIGVGVRYV
eukprot:617773-Karenia_brevis.AAC.1